MQRHGEQSFPGFPLCLISSTNLGAITTIDAVVPLRIPRFKAPKYERTSCPS